MEIEGWRDRFLLAAENALRARPKDEDALKNIMRNVLHCSTLGSTMPPSFPQTMAVTSSASQGVPSR